MTEATQTATPTDAREASMSRVTTLDDILRQQGASEATSEPAKSEKTEPEQPKEGEAKPKQSAQERIQELARKRREAEAKAEAVERENADLKARLDALSASAKPLEAEEKPIRSKYASDDEYHEALTDWKVKQALAKREQEQAQAREEAAQAELVDKWSKRQEAAMKELPDYAEVIGKSEIDIPNHVHAAILKSDQGPHIAYYLALHPEEAKKIGRMDPIDAVWRVREIASDLAEISRDTPSTTPAKEEPKPQKSKAPPPLDLPKSVPSTSPSGQSDYEEYKRRRQAEQRK